MTSLVMKSEFGLLSEECPSTTFSLNLIPQFD